jgi:Delta7-sterol 5-desaturase
MDLVLKICDDYLLDNVWTSLIPHSALSLTSPDSAVPSNISTHSIVQMSAWPRDYMPRQLISLCIITLIGIHVLYFLFSWLSYRFVFNHEMMKHPRFLQNQVELEIQTSLRAFPGMMLLTLPWFQAEVMGYSKLYSGLDTYGYFYLFASIPLCVFLLSHFQCPHTHTL